MQDKDAAVLSLCERKENDMVMDINERAQKLELKGFICKADLPGRWSNDDIETLFPGPVFTRQQRDEIREKHIVLLSILVYIGLPKSVGVSTFRGMFHHRCVQTGNSDDRQLPLDDVRDIQQALGVLDARHARWFLDSQHYFLPHTIKTNLQDVQELSGERRLPFIEQPEKLGSGGFGTVYKATVAKGCFEFENGQTISNTMVVAFKRFAASDKKFFDDERRNLRALTSNAKSKLLVEHFCHIRYLDYWYIFSLYAQYGDLEIFLNAGHRGRDPNSTSSASSQSISLASIGSASASSASASRSSMSTALTSLSPPPPPSDSDPTMYVFSDAFSAPEQHHAIEQLRNIAGALNWLHHGHAAFGSEWAHMDVKPNNILVYPLQTENADTVGNVGKWLLADFGISAHRLTNPSSYVPESRALSGRNAGFRSSSTPRVLQGTYYAPELQAINVRANRRLCDIWSFGCIVNEVFAFISQGIDKNGTRARANLWDFRRMKNDPADNGDTWHSTRSGHFTLKDSVRNWLDAQYQRDDPIHNRNNWKKDMSQLVLNVLQIDSVRRKDIKDILLDLSKIHQRCKEDILPAEPPRGHVLAPVQEENSSEQDETQDDKVLIEYCDVEPVPNVSAQENQIGVPRGGVKSFDMTADTSLLAFLFKVGKTFGLRFYKQDYVDFQEPDKYKALLNQGETWSNVTLGEGLLILSGTARDGKSTLCLFFDIADIDDPTRIVPPRGWPDNGRRIICSHDMVVCESSDRRRIHIWKRSTGSTDSRLLGVLVRYKCMNARGDFLFVWAQTDHRTLEIQRYNVEDGRLDLLEKILFDIRPDDQAERTTKMWPSPDGKICVYQEFERGARYLLLFNGSPERGLKIEEPVLQATGWASVLSDGVLLTTRKAGKWTEGWVVVDRRIVHTDTSNVKSWVEQTSKELVRIKRLDTEDLKIGVHLTESGERIVLLNKKGGFWIQNTPVRITSSSRRNESYESQGRRTESYTAASWNTVSRFS